MQRKGRSRFVSLRNLITSDDQTAERIAKARTPETRIRIRRWSRVETIGILATLLGIFALLAAPPTTLALIIWFTLAGIDRTDVYWWLWGVTLGISAAGAIMLAVGSHLRVKATFSDGYVTVGRVDNVIECPAAGDDPAWYELRISAEMPGGVVLRRKAHRDGRDPRRRVGRSIRFRHNTLEPDDLHDVHVDGFPGADPKGTRS